MQTYTEYVKEYNLSVQEYCKKFQIDNYEPWTATKVYYVPEHLVIAIDSDNEYISEAMSEAIVFQSLIYDWCQTCDWNTEIDYSGNIKKIKMSKCFAKAVIEIFDSPKHAYHQRVTLDGKIFYFNPLQDKQELEKKFNEAFPKMLTKEEFDGRH